MKFLIYGTNGWIGNKVYTHIKSMKQNIEVVQGNSRVNDINQLEKEIQEVQPTHVISLIGRTHGTYEGTYIGTIDYLEKPGKVYENVRDNLFSPIVLAILCKKHNMHFTYLGTGCIFKFDEEHPFGDETTGFTEGSLPNFFGSGYSVVKGFTDELMHLFDDSVLNLRIRMPITDELNPRNFITKIITYEYICSIPNAMTVLDELLPYVLNMAKNNITGTINLTNPGLVSHNEILEMYKDIVDPEFTWKNFTPEEQSKILDADRSNNCLDTTKLSTMYHDIKNIKESVRDTLIRMKSKLDNE